MGDRPVVGDKIPVLPGPSALACARVGYYSALSTVVTAVVWPFVARATASKDSSLSGLAVVLLIVGLLCAASMMVLLVLYRLRIRAESRAQYTTTWRKFQYFPELNPRTGKVVRAADEPFLDRSTYKARMRAD